MAIDVLWAAWDGRGLEHLRLVEDAEAVRADSLIIAFDDAGRAFRARYVVDCNSEWQVTRVRIEMLETPGRTLEMRADGHGRWTDARTGPVPSLAECIDVDIYPSPFTNTLPLRRLPDAVPGRPVAITVAWVALPELTVRAAAQEYTLLDRGPEGARWRFRAIDSDFSVELVVDRNGIVLDYPGLARRLP